jgi:hypothetical protein
MPRKSSNEDGSHRSFELFLGSLNVRPSAITTTRGGWSKTYCSTTFTIGLLIGCQEEEWVRFNLSHVQQQWMMKFEFRSCTTDEPSSNQYGLLGLLLLEPNEWLDLQHQFSICVIQFLYSGELCVSCLHFSGNLVVMPHSFGAFAFFNTSSLCDYCRADINYSTLQ